MDGRGNCAYIICTVHSGFHSVCICAESHPGSHSGCLGNGIVVEADEELQVESLSKYKNTGQKRVLLLAKADDIPENRDNYDILLNSL